MTVLEPFVTAIHMYALFHRGGDLYKATVQRMLQAQPLCSKEVPPWPIRQGWTAPSTM